MMNTSAIKKTDSGLPFRIVTREEDVNQGNLHFENKLIHSRLRRFEKQVEDSGLSIKMGMNGVENYHFNNGTLQVTADQYIIVNRHQSFTCQIDHPVPVYACCIYLSSDLLEEVAGHAYKKQKELLEQPGIRGGEQEFLEKEYSLLENDLGKYLLKMRRYFSDENALFQLDYQELFYEIAERLLSSHRFTQEALVRIPCQKTATQKELFRRLSIAYTYIHEHFRQSIQLDELAKVAMLSKFHLLRSFKSVYATTPYQLVLKLRLEKAKELLARDQSLEEVAFQLGFSDRRAFTKAFKRTYQMTPSSYRIHQQLYTA
jgi:AraC family transcriptional regulator